MGFLDSFSTGCLVKFWAPILATSKAQQLLFRIVDCLLLPHSVLQQDKELPVALLSAIQESLPLYLQVNISTLVSADKHIFRKIFILQRLFSFSLIKTSTDQFKAAARGVFSSCRSGRKNATPLAFLSLHAAMMWYSPELLA